MQLNKAIMKKVIIKKFTHAEVDAPKETFGFLKIPFEHKLIRAEGEELEVSDGYHTMSELYDHRITLFICLMRVMKRWEHSLGAYSDVWRSKQHYDGSMFEGDFIMGFRSQPGEQVTYHIPLERWEETDFAKTIERAPKWDGHTPADVLERLKKW